MITVYRIDNSLFKAGLFQDIVQRTGRNINVRLTSNRNDPRLETMLELAMAPFHASLTPAIVLKQFDDLSNFHAIT